MDDGIGSAEPKVQKAGCRDDGQALDERKFEAQAEKDEQHGSTLAAERKPSQANQRLQPQTSGASPKIDISSVRHSEDIGPGRLIRQSRNRAAQTRNIRLNGPLLQCGTGFASQICNMRLKRGTSSVFCGL